MKKLVQTSVLSGLATLSKILTGILGLKIVALYTGPKGVAILGQFMAIANVFSVISGGGISLGVVKYVAEYKFSNELAVFLSSTTLYTLFFSLLTTFIGFIFSSELALWIFDSSEYGYLIKWLALVQSFIAMYLLFTSLITGVDKVRLLITVTILVSVVSLGITCFLSIFYNLEGALVALLVSQAIAVFICVGFIYREKWFASLFLFKMSRKHLFNLSRYSIMTIVSTLTVPISQIVVRNDINALLGWRSVGYWQSVVRLSDAYLLFITTALTTYYLPRLSELKANKDLKKEIKQTYQMLMPIIGLMLVIIYTLRGFIIRVLYSDAFVPATDLFMYQLLGDFFKSAGWLFTYLLLAKSWTKTYIGTEIILSILFVGISHVFLRHYGLIGVTYAFGLTYFIYWLLMFNVAHFYFKRGSCDYS